MPSLQITKIEVLDFIRLSKNTKTNDRNFILADAVNKLPLQKQNELIALMEYGNALNEGSDPEDIFDLLSSYSPIKNPAEYLSVMEKFAECLEEAITHLHPNIWPE